MAQNPAQQRQSMGPADGDDYNGAGPYYSEAFPMGAQPGDFVFLMPEHETYRVESVIAVADLVAFSSDDGEEIDLSANGSDLNNEASILQMQDNHLAQVRCLKLGADLPADVEVTIDQGGNEAPMFQVKNAQAVWTRESSTEMGHDGSSVVTNDDLLSVFTELWVYEDQDVPKFSFFETGGGTPTIDGLRFSGYVYRLTEQQVSSGSRRAIPIPTKRLER